MEPDIDVLRVFLRVALVVTAAALIVAIVTDSDRTLVGIAACAATGAALIFYIWREPKVGN